MYNIVRMYYNNGGRVTRRIIKRNVSLAEARRHCNDPETSSSTATSYAARKRTERVGAWFDGYEEA